MSEYLGRLGRRMFGRNYRLPRRLDIGLRGVKYLLLGLFLFAVGSMSASAIQAFLGGPYGILDDVKMLNFFRFLGVTGGLVVALLVVASILVREFLVPLSLPVRRADGTGGAGEPAAHPPRYLAVHRLRPVHESVPVGAAGGAIDRHPIGGMHRLSAMRGGVPRGGRARHDRARTPARAGLGSGGDDRGRCSWESAGTPAGAAIGGPICPSAHVLPVDSRATVGHSCAAYE